MGAVGNVRRPALWFHSTSVDMLSRIMTPAESGVGKNSRKAQSCWPVGSSSKSAQDIVLSVQQL